MTESDATMSLAAPLLSTSNDLERQGINASRAPTLSPPYARFPLAISSLPPPLPPLLRTITTDEWNSFWLQMKPLVVSLEKFNRYASITLVVAIIAWLGFFYGLFIHETCDEYYNREEVWYPTFLFIFSPILLHGLAVLVSRMRQPLLCKIQALCRDGDVFHTHGFSLECVQLYSDNSVEQLLHLFLYISPDNTPHTRFEVDNGLVGYSSTYTSSTMAMQSFEVRPYGFEAIPFDEWTEFWSTMRKINATTVMPRRLCPLLWMIPLGVPGFLSRWLLFSPPNLERLVHVAVLLGLVVVFFFALFYFVKRRNTFLSARNCLVHDFSRRCASYGIYMELRPLTCYHPCYGYVRHDYVYMFRVDNQDIAVDPANDTGSSSARSESLLGQRRTTLTDSYIQDPCSRPQ